MKIDDIVQAEALIQAYLDSGNWLTANGENAIVPIEAVKTLLASRVYLGEQAARVCCSRDRSHCENRSYSAGNEAHKCASAIRMHFGVPEEMRSDTEMHDFKFAPFSKVKDI